MVHRSCRLQYGRIYQMLGSHNRNISSLELLLRDILLHWSLELRRIKRTVVEIRRRLLIETHRVISFFQDSFWLFFLSLRLHFSLIVEHWSTWTLLSKILHETFWLTSVRLIPILLYMTSFFKNFSMLGIEFWILFLLHLLFQLHAIVEFLHFLFRFLPSIKLI